MFGAEKQKDYLEKIVRKLIKTQSQKVESHQKPEMRELRICTLFCIQDTIFSCLSHFLLLFTKAEHMN